MITPKQFEEMEPGTDFYVAAPGLHRMVESNNLCKERFVEFRKSVRGYHIITESGGIAFSYGKNGKSFFLDFSEAVDYMEDRHVEIYRWKLKNMASQIERLKKELSTLEKRGCGVPDYLYTDRTKGVMHDS